MNQQYYVYILASKPHGVLYIGVTSDMIRRVWQHRSGEVEGFTKRYHVKQLVYFEIHEEIEQAILREKRLKRWKRAKKVDLIERHNADWRDLYDDLVGSSHVS